MCSGFCREVGFGKTVDLQEEFAIPCSPAIEIANPAILSLSSHSLTLTCLLTLREKFLPPVHPCEGLYDYVRALAGVVSTQGTERENTDKKV